MALSLNRDFKEFLRSLNSEKVEYLVIGGHAVGHYGYVRTTGDLDVWISISPENAKRVAAALQAFGFGAFDPKTFLQSPKIFRMGVQPVRIELLTGIAGVDFAEAYSRREATVIDGVPVAVIGFEDLKTNKKASGRLKDLADIDELEKRSRRDS